MKYNDSLTSLTTSLNTEHSKQGAATYVDSSRSATEYQKMYRSSPNAQIAIDLIVEDSLSNGKFIEDIDKNEAYKLKLEELGYNVALEKALKSYRLIGQGYIYLVGGGNPNAPLSGKIQQITYVDAKLVKPLKYETDVVNPLYDKSEFYELGDSEVHHTRLIIFENRDQDKYHSSLDAAYDVIKALDATIANAAELVHSSDVDVFGVPELMDIAADPVQEAALVKRFQLANAQKSNVKSLVIDTEETFERHSISMSGYDSLIHQFTASVASAVRIPLRRFLGDGSSGMSDGGTTEMALYHKTLSTFQTNVIDPPTRLFEATILKEVGGDRVKWLPLGEPTANELADIATKLTNAFKSLAETELLSPDELRAAMFVTFDGDSGINGLEEETNPDLGVYNEQETGSTNK